MDSLMAKWKSTVTAQKERQKSVGKTRPQTSLIKKQAQRIVDILLPGQPPARILYIVTQFQQVCDVLSHITEKTEEFSRKLTPSQDFESQLDDLEREKIYLRRDNNELKKKIDDLQRQLFQLSLAQDLVGLVKESQIRLMETNKLLMDDLKILKSAQQDKDRVWEMELNDIKSSLSLLRE